MNVWNAVHTIDAARLYRLVLEKAPAGQRWHAVGEEAVPFRSIAEAIGSRLGLPVRSLSDDEAPPYFGGFLNFGRMNCPASGDYTRATLGWKPIHNSILEDLALPHYFQ
jgi:nucleoside-diphosphate-sugar epimerase